MKDLAKEQGLTKEGSSMIGMGRRLWEDQFAELPPVAENGTAGLTLGAGALLCGTIIVDHDIHLDEGLRRQGITQDEIVHQEDALGLPQQTEALVSENLGKIFLLQVLAL